MAIPRSVHEFSIDPAYFALRPPKGGGGGGDYDALERRVTILEECCAEVTPQIVYITEVVERLDKMVPITNPEIDILFN